MNTNVSKNVPFLKSVVLTLVSLVCTLNLFAKDIYSNADWASVTASDEVVIKMNGTTTIPSDITCKKISFEQNYTTLNLNGHTLTIENMYMSNREGIKITNGGTVHATNVFEFKTKGGSINANIIADQDFRMSDQESMSIIGNVSVGKDFYMQSKKGSVTGDVIVGGKFYMNNQEEMSVNGNVSANGGFVMQSKNGSVTGDVVVSHGDIEMTNQESMSIGGSINVSGNFNIQSKNVQVGGPGATIEVGGNLNMTNQENMDIQGDVSVEGDVTMQTKGGSIIGNVSVGGNLNMTNQENMKIDGDVAVVGNLTISGNGSNISGTAAVGGNTNTSNGATISGGTTEYTGPISGGEEPSGEEPSEPNCGLDVPPIYSNKTSICLQDIKDGNLSAPSVSGAKTQTWKVNDSSVDDLTNVNVGDVITYCVTDANDIESCSPNSVKVQDIPSISPTDDISYCAADGGYDLSKYIVTDNGATTTTTWKLNETIINNSSKPTLSAGDKLYVKSENVCGSIEATMNVSNGCTPKIPTLSNPTAICSGGSIVLPTPTLEYYDESLPNNTKEWQVSTDGGNTWKTFSNSNLSYSTYNGAKIRLKATNEVGTEYSNEITLTVNSDAPGFTYTKSPNQTTLSQSLGGTPASVTYTLKKDNECNNDPISISINNSSDFEISGNTVKLKGGKGVGTYTTKVTFTQAGETKTEDITVSVVEWPKTYILKKICGGTESDYPVTTDENGKLNIQLRSDDNCEYINEGTIECTEFTLTTSASDHFSGKFVNKGTIKADKIYYGTSSKKLGGSDAVYFDCGGTFIANDLEMNYNTITTSLKGTFLINNSFYIAPAQGQNFEINKCTNIKTYSTDINVSGGSMEISIHGHVNTEYFDVNIPNITSYEDAIITVGHLEASNLNLVISESSLLNLCTNPTKGAPDNIGYIYGTVMYLSDESTGWVDDITPITEGDLNHNDNSSAYWTTKNKYGEPIAKEVIPAYKSYKDCIDEKADPSFLGIDDDPFLPKDKEIHKLYNCNPCSKDFEDAKMEIREIHGKTFRLINGELIYCENDN